MSIVIDNLPLSSMTVTSEYGQRTLSDGTSGFHYGIDLAAAENTPIYNVRDGVVKVTGSDPDGWGNYIVVEHTADKFCTLYAHMLRFALGMQIGTSVPANGLLGYADNTGHSFGSHLHFEILNSTYSVAFNGTAANRHKYNVNPYNYLIGAQAAETGGSAATSYISYSNGQLQYSADFTGTGTTDPVTITGEGTTGGQLFGRNYRILIYDSAGNALDVSNLRVVFKAQKAVLQTLSQASVMIYNLSVETENQVIDNAAKVSIEAGYGDGNLFGTIYTGNVIQVSRYKEGNLDYVTKLIAINGMLDMYTNISSYSIIRGQTKRQVLDTISRDAGVTLNTSQFKASNDNQIDSPYIRGKVVFDKLGNELYKSMASSEYSVAFWDNLEFKLATVDTLSSNEILDINFDSGLIEAPVQTDYQVTFTCLLNPRIELNSLIHLDNSWVTEQEYTQGGTYYTLDANGIYRVIALSYSGDTRGQDWYVTCEAVSQDGAIPTMFASFIKG